MKIQNGKYLASILFLLIGFVCNAQGGGTPPPPIPPPPPGLPIDDYLPLFVLVALVFGIVKRYRFSKN